MSRTQARLHSIQRDEEHGIEAQEIVVEVEEHAGERRGEAGDRRVFEEEAHETLGDRFQSERQTVEAPAAHNAELSDSVYSS